MMKVMNVAKWDFIGVEDRGFVFKSSISTLPEYTIVNEGCLDFGTTRAYFDRSNDTYRIRIPKHNSDLVINYLKATFNIDGALRETDNSVLINV